MSEYCRLCINLRGVISSHLDGFRNSAVDMRSIWLMHRLKLRRARLLGKYRRVLTVPKIFNSGQGIDDVSL